MTGSLSRWATLIEVDPQQFDETFELFVRCYTRELLTANPDNPPDQIIAGVQQFIETVTRGSSRSGLPE
jgi:hypothetical protein